MKAILPHKLARGQAAETPLALKSFTPLAFDGINITARHELPAATKVMRTRSILVVSEDAALADGLCWLAAKDSLSVVRMPSLREAMEEANRVHPAAIVVDLDSSSDAGWKVAEWFLGHRPNVPILILTEHADHHELGLAIRSGTVFEKSLGSARLLQAVVAILEESAPQGQGRVARQQALLHRAKPYRWSVAAASAYRHWGINE